MIKQILLRKNINDTEIEVLKIIIDNPNISKIELASKFDWTPRMVERPLYVLEVLGYIKKENPSSRKSPWIVLRNIDDIKTCYTMDENNIKVANQ